VAREGARGAAAEGAKVGGVAAAGGVAAEGPAEGGGAAGGVVREGAEDKIIPPTTTGTVFLGVAGFRYDFVKIGCLLTEKVI
jgi:hypothetical protein